MKDLDQKLTEFYNKNFFYFSRLKKHDKRFYKNVLDAVNKFKLNIKKKKVLDVGSGTGELLRILKEEYGDYLAIGTDLSEIGLKMHQYGRPVRADARKLPFADKYFDFVFCIDVLEHIPYHDKVIEETCRVTKPGGYILIRTQNYDCPFLSFPQQPDLTIKKEIIADRDAVSRTKARNIMRKLQMMNGTVLIYESWGSFNWRIPILKIFNFLPILKHFGGTCTILFRKS